MEYLEAIMSLFQKRAPSDAFGVEMQSLGLSTELSDLSGSSAASGAECNTANFIKPLFQSLLVQPKDDSRSEDPSESSCQTQTEESTAARFTAAFIRLALPELGCVYRKACSLQQLCSDGGVLW